MKTLKLISFLLITVMASAQVFKTPVDYLSYIGKEQENITRSTWKYTSAIAHSKSARRIDNTRKLLVKNIDAATAKIQAISNGYNGDTEYQNQILQYLDMVRKSINEEYEKIIDMQEVSTQSYDFMEAYIMAKDMINKKMDDEFEKVKLAQNKFAQKYKITLTDNNSELGKKIQLSNEVFDYHTELYLLFFKSNVTDTYLSKAIENKDLSAIQQNASALEQYSNEGLEKLKTIAPYQNDKSMIEITQKALLFYKDQTQQYIPKIINYLMLSEKFDNAKKTMESKSKNDITQEEVNNYNTLVKQMNQEINNYNKLNISNNNEKNAILNQWNTTSDNFINTHVPRD